MKAVIRIDTVLIMFKFTLFCFITFYVSQYFIPFTKQEQLEGGREDSLPPGVKSLSSSAPNSPLLQCKMVNRPRLQATHRTAVVQPNSSSITMTQKLYPNKSNDKMINISLTINCDNNNSYNSN